MVAPLVFPMYHALGACLLKETNDGTFGHQYARCNRLTIKHARGSGHTITPHGAWTLQDTAVLTSEAGSLHGNAAGSRSPAGFQPLVRGGGGGAVSRAPRGECEASAPRPDAEPRRVPPNEVPAELAPLLDAEVAYTGSGLAGSC